MAKQKTLRVGIIGAGLIGHKRAESISRAAGNKLMVVADANITRAAALAGKFGIEAMGSWRDLIARDDIDAVVIAVPNAFAAAIAIAALKGKKHVLCEKPFGVTTKESRAILTAASVSGRLAKAGFNHRFHPAIAKAKTLFNAGAIGEPIFIRARYGHGGRQGMEKEWRFNKKISGGGELLDQGVHVIDLARWFGGEYTSAYGVCEAKVWKSPVEDNAFAVMKNNKVTATFHVSTTNWGNIFSFEVFGDQGYLIVDGLGRRYGVETLRFGKRKLKFGDVTLKTFEFPKGRDMSWELEWKNFARAIQGKEKLNGSGEDGLRANELVEAIYKAGHAGKEVRNHLT